MRRVSIKEAFGGEVPFTKYIADNKEVAKRLLDAIDEGMSDGFSIAPEDQTVDRKRVDLVVRDDDNNVVQVIESQDATGWLDSVHASKIAYYCYEKGCMDGVLLTEDADEHIKGFIRWYNENTPLNIYLFNVVIYSTDAGKYVDFIPVMRPFSLKDKKIQRRATAKADEENFAEFLSQKMEELPGKFTHQTNWYVSKNNVANTGINVGIHPRKSGYHQVMLYHNSKYHKNLEFENSVKDLFQNDTWKFLQTQTSTKRTTWDESIELFDALVDSLETKQIKFS